MWVISEIGFFSVVQKPEDGNLHLTVRARMREDLERLYHKASAYMGTQAMWQASIQVDAGTDYPYRIQLVREVWADALARLGREVDYPNFKARVEDKGWIGKARASILHRVWSALVELTWIERHCSDVHDVRLTAQHRPLVPGRRGR